MLFGSFLGAGLVAGPVGPGVASNMPHEQQFAVERPVASADGSSPFTREELDDVLNELPKGVPSWTMHTGFEPVEYLYFSLMSDEDWSDWQDFIRARKKVIPLGSVRRVMYLVNSGFLEKRPLELGWDEPEKAKAYIDVLRRMYYQPESPQLGYVRLDAPEPKRSRWKMFGFLTERDGLFSGRAWSWDNFLPRLFTVAGMLIGGLLGVEILRLFIRAGLRLGERRKGGASGFRR